MVVQARRGLFVRGDGWALEPKLDGWRALVRVGERVTVTTRNGRDITDRLPELRGVTAALHGHSALLDGELVAGQGLPGDFYRLGQRLRARRATSTVTFAAFDILELNGEPMIGLPYSERRRRLADLVEPAPAWIRVPWFTDDLTDVFVQCVRHGLEGVVAKRCTSPYRPGERSPDWIKTKAPTWRQIHAPRRHQLV